MTRVWGLERVGVEGESIAEVKYVLVLQFLERLTWRRIVNREVYKVTLGGVIVRLRNKAGVCKTFLDDIFSNSGLDGRELLLSLSLYEFCSLDSVTR